MIAASVQLLLRSKNSTVNRKADSRSGKSSPNRSDRHSGSYRSKSRSWLRRVRWYSSSGRGQSLRGRCNGSSGLSIFLVLVSIAVVVDAMLVGTTATTITSNLRRH